MKERFLQIQKWSLSIITACVMSVFLLAVSAIPSYAASGDKPHVTKAGSISVSEEGMTRKLPFAAGTAGSQYLRIPTLITLENGDLLETADARWEDPMDGGGIDIIASVSSDGGKTWNYSFPFFFPDSNGFSGHSSEEPFWSNATTIIDSCILEGSDGTVYCFADVNPTGATLLYQNHYVTDHADGYYIGNNPALPCVGSVGTGTGYVTVNGKRYLALTKDYTKVLTEPTDTDLETYPYYVGDFTNGYAPILKRSDSAPTEFGVDEWYNLYTVDDAGEYIDNLRQMQVESSELNTDETWEIQQNVYYEGSQFHIYCIPHIWMVSSKDHGRTWTDPKDINDQIKRHTDEHALLVSPGKGIVTSDGTILFGVYDIARTTDSQSASIVYSSDCGKTWKRSNDVPDMWTSENEIVEIDDGKGTLRMFLRNGTGTMFYADAKKNENGEYQFESVKNTNITVCSDCNLTALSYSRKINGKQAVIVACPSKNGRMNGKIYTFLVNDDDEHTMELENIFSIGDSYYSYSCLTERKDGSLALLYERGSWSGIFLNTYDINSIVPDVDIENIPVEVEINEGEAYTISGSGNDEITLEPDSSCVTYSVSEESYFGVYDHSGTGIESDLRSFASASNEERNLSAAEFTFTASGDFWQIKNEKENLYLVNTNAEAFFDENAANMRVAEVSGKDRFYISQDNGDGYVIFYTQEMNFNRMRMFIEGDTGYEISLLEKQETVSESDIIPGYKLVSGAAELKNGRKYLIAYIWDDSNIMILYPVNGKFDQTKRLDLSQPITYPVVTVTGKSEGYTSMAIGGITYKIHVKKSIDVIKQKLQNAVEKAKAQIINSSNYSGETLEKMQTILEGFTEILTDPDAAMEDVSKAYETLNSVIKVDQARTQLKNEIAEAEKQLADTAGYTNASINSLKAAVARAQEVLNKLDNADADTYLAGLDHSLDELSGALSAIKGQTLVKETVKVLTDGGFFEADGMKYQIVSAAALTVKLMKGKDTAKLKISTVVYDEKTYRIVKIGDAAFSGCKKLKKVTLGASVAAIGKNAFKGCKKLVNVVIQKNSKLSKVGVGAFKKTSSKIKIKLPKNLKKKKKLKKQLKKAGIKKSLLNSL